MTVEQAALRFTGFESNRPDPNINNRDQPTVTVFKSTAAPSEAAGVKTRSATSVYNDGYAADLVVVELAGAKVRRLVKGSKPCTYWPSPDGAYIAYTNLKDNAGQLRFDLMAYSLRDTVPITLAANLNQGFVALSVSWSTNGTLSYTTLESQPRGQLRRECYIVSPNSTPRRVTGTPAKGFSSPLRAPLWDKSGQSSYLISGNSLWRVPATNATAVEVARMRDRNIVDIVPSTVPGRFWSPDDDGSLLVTTSDPESLRVGFSRINLTTGEVTSLIEEDKVYGAGNPLLPGAMGTPDGRSLLYIAEDAGHNPDFWIFDGSLRDAQRVTNTNPEFDKYVMGASTLVEWRGPGGERLRGALLFPAVYKKGKRYQLFVSIYPD
jgi:dipeptidyl aminopeptidase/acylaminoacyl peptidase